MAARSTSSEVTVAEAAAEDNMRIEGVELDPIFRVERGTRVTRKEGFSKIGRGVKSVKGFTTATNYLHLCNLPTRDLLRYHVDIHPKVDSTAARKKIFDSQKDVIGVDTLFDGEVLYTNRPVPMDKRRLISVSERNTDDERNEYVMTIDPTGIVTRMNTSFLHLLNVLMHKALELVGFERIDKHYYDRQQAIKFEHQLELWPGMITAVRNHDAGVLVCLEPVYKILRMASIWDILDALKHKHRHSKDDFENAAKKLLIGTTVIAHYDRRYYRIDDISFKVTPSSKFRVEDGSQMTYLEYYSRQYNLLIVDETQPMLISFPTRKDENKGVNRNIYLVPALCNPAGLSDEMKKNDSLMVRINQHLKLGPNLRKTMLYGFAKKLKDSPAVQEEFAKWNVDFVPDFVAADCRIFPSEEIFMGPKGSLPIRVDLTMDWTHSLKGQSVLIPTDLSEWILFAPTQVLSLVSNLVTELHVAGKSININVAPPVKTVEYGSANELPGVLRDELVKAQTSQPVKFVFVVLPEKNSNIYGEVKKTCTLQFGIGSQCMLAENVRLTGAKGMQKLGSICTNVMVQIIAKMGGVPWGVRIGALRLMVLGYKVQKCSERKGLYVGALVSTMDQTLNKYFSTVTFQADKNELASSLYTGIKKSLEAYRMNNAGAIPDRIVLYRNGDGEGQINFILDYEIPPLKRGIQHGCDDFKVPAAKLSVIIVSKRVKSRIILTKSGRGRQVLCNNVPPGTVLDNVITLPERYDFFMEAHPVNQGTARLTNYNVVYDESRWVPDIMQILTYKLCHLDYNRCGTVATPAPCKYAEKLAYLSGVHLNQEAPCDLATKFWYL